MAVEATHFNRFSQQQLIPEFLSPAKGSGFGFGYNAQISSPVPFATQSMPAEVLLPSLNRSLVCGSVPAKPAMTTDSGLSYHLLPEVSRKRSRPDDFSVSGEDVLPVFQYYQSEIDQIVSNHTRKLRMELEERQKVEARILVAAIGEDVMKKVREKDEQIQALGKLNFALQERVKGLYMENQLWRDLALTNEATAHSLRTNLEQVLAYDHVSGGAAAADDDVESCCDSSDHGADFGSPAAGTNGTGTGNGRLCRRCGERESSVLLLPCRHLCLCTLCGSTLLESCPVCNSSMNATVHVNMSSS